MDEVIKTKSFSTKLLEKSYGIFVIEPVSFSKKKRINLRGIAWLGCVFLGLFCVVVFIAPAPEEEIRNYSESKSAGRQEVSGEQVPAPSMYLDNPLSTDAIRSYASDFGGAGGKGSGSNRNTTMIIARENDSSMTLPPGTKFSVKLTQNVTVTAHAIPVIGRIVSSVSSQSSIAIPEDSQIFGEATLDADTERASINWKSILFPDGRSKNVSAIALGADNQAGVDGNYHSDAVKNTAGQMISRFVGGFAEGAINPGAMGANQGRVQNGLLQGAVDMAKDRTEAWSEDLKKQRAWLDLEAGVQFQTILSQPFNFRDPGGVN